MDHLSPAAQATLDALAEIGQGNVHEVREKTGKARSTTDKALKELADSGLIVEVELGEDQVEGAPTRWQLANPVAGTETLAQDQTPVASHPSAYPTATSDGATEPARPASDTVAGGSGHNVGQASEGATTDEAPARPTRPADRKVLIVAGVLGDYPTGTTVDVIADACGLGVATVARLLTAMERADAARRVPADPETGTPELWKPGEGRASAVDPNPAAERCPTCGQVIRATRTRGAGAGVAREPAPLNSDGSEPLGRNVLRGMVLDFINAHPGHVFTPQDIATEVSARHNRTISNGAVRNNCTTLAAAGQIQLATETPLAFTANPTPPDSDSGQ